MLRRSLRFQHWVGAAAAIIIVLAEVNRMAAHFQAQPPAGKRGERYVYLETGALAQNVHLQATALGLSMVLVGGFDDDMVSGALGTAPSLHPAAMLCIGKPFL